MRVLAAPGDTWGIPGPTFLIGYVVLAGVVVWLTILLRRGIARGPLTDHPAPQSDPFALALLAGGPVLVVNAAIAGLRSRHLVTAASGGGVTTKQQPPKNLHPVENAVLRAIAGGRKHVYRLVTDERVTRAIADVRKGLERDGLVLDGVQRALHRLVGLLPLTVLALGAVRWWAGVQHDRPVGYLTLLLIALVVVQFVLALWGAPDRTRAGERTLTDEVARHDHLKPEYNPSWGAYGAGAAAMGVALFGTAALFAADPAFAAEAELRRQAAAGSASSSGTSGSSCSSSSSCSSGSSCSGGSGCGGGGGCGG